MPVSHFLCLGLGTDVELNLNVVVKIAHRPSWIPLSITKWSTFVKKKSASFVMVSATISF